MKHIGTESTRPVLPWESRVLQGAGEPSHAQEQTCAGHAVTSAVSSPARPSPVSGHPRFWAMRAVIPAREMLH